VEESFKLYKEKAQSALAKSNERATEAMKQAEESGREMEVSNRGER